MPVKINSSGGGSVTLDSGSTANNATITLPGVNGTMATLGTVTNNGVVYVNSSGQPTSGSALTFDGTTLKAQSGSSTPALRVFGVGTSQGQISFNSTDTYVIQGGPDYLAFNFLTNGATRYSIDPTGQSIWSVSGSEQMRLTSTGLGIGTSSPGAKLHAKSSSNEVAYFESTSASNYSYAFLKTATGNGVYLGSDGNGSFVVQTPSGGYSTKMMVDSSGNLGLGVTPSAWTTYKATQVGWSALAGYAAADTAVFSNSFFDGGYKYIGNGFASQYRQINSQHQWHTAPSGTAGNAISFTQAMTLDASGNLLVGTASPPATGKISAVGSSGGIALALSDNVNSSLYMRPAAGGVVIGTDGGNALRFATNGNATGDEKMRIDSAGVVLVNRTSYSSGITNACKFQVLSTGSEFAAAFENSSASIPYGMRMYYSGAAPNGTGSQFLYCSDTSAVRMEVRSNGGIANYSANNVNLSDERTKTDIKNAESYLAKICAIPVRTFKYKDQTDAILNLGVIAQEVEAVAPELVDATGFGETPEDGIPLKAIYQTDFQYALMKCIQELKAELDELKAKVK